MKKMLKSFWGYSVLALLLCAALFGALHRAADRTHPSKDSHVSVTPATSLGGISSGRQAQQTQEKAEIKQLTVGVTTSRENEPVFDLTIADFVSSFDGFYWEDHKALYFPASSHWVSYTRENAPHSKYSSEYYRFQKDPSQTSQPFLSVYVPTGERFLQTITLDFDDHGYTEQRHAEYKMVCFYTLKVLFPTVEAARLKELVDTLDSAARGSIVATPYGLGVTPSVLYYKGAIGLYPYFSAGESSRICITPVSPHDLKELAANGVELHALDAQWAESAALAGSKPAIR